MRPSAIAGERRYRPLPSLAMPRLDDAMRTLLIGLLGALVAAPVVAAGEIYDGDSMEIEGQRARLHGIDAFELQQTCLDARGRPWRCGVAAKAALAERAEGHALNCVVLDEDEDGAYVARCLADGTDLSAYMVKAGLALADRDRSNDYLEEEAEARRRGVGAWEGAFLPPWQWRSSRR
jgi:endonuclease YncB( thermonuclease family)